MDGERYECMGRGVDGEREGMDGESGVCGKGWMGRVVYVERGAWGEEGIGRCRRKY